MSTKNTPRQELCVPVGQKEVVKPVSASLFMTFKQKGLKRTTHRLRYSHNCTKGNVRPSQERNQLKKEKKKCPFPQQNVFRENSAAAAVGTEGRVNKPSLPAECRAAPSERDHIRKQPSPQPHRGELGQHQGCGRTRRTAHYWQYELKASMDNWNHMAPNPPPSPRLGPIQLSTRRAT